jgi:hypothetical protein
VNREINDLVAGLAAPKEPPAWDAAPGEWDLGCERFAAGLMDKAPSAARAAAGLMTARQVRLLARCSVRTAGQALGLGSEELCRRALLMLVVSHRAPLVDERDVMVFIAPHHIAATTVEGSAARLFGWAADRGALDHQKVYRDFGARSDVTLEAFGWKLVPRDGHDWFVPSW